MNPGTSADRRILLTGATGYVGGRLLARLEQRGLALRCLARRPEILAGRVGARTQVVQGEVLRTVTLPAALEGVDTAFYLVNGRGRAHRRFLAGAAVHRRLRSKPGDTRHGKANGGTR